MHLNFPSVQGPLDPFILPGKEFDEFDGANEFIQDSHTFVAGGRKTFVNTELTTGEEGVQRPYNENNEESRESGDTEEPEISCLGAELIEGKKENLLVEENAGNDDLEWSCRPFRIAIGVVKKT